MSKKDVKLWTMDTETRGLFGELFRIGLYDGENYYYGNTFDEVYKYIVNSSIYFDNHIYIHNLDFDLSKIAPNLFTMENIDFSKSLFINGSVATLKTDTFVLHDSVKLLPSSLDKLSDDFGLTKTHKMHIDDYIIQRGWAVYNEDGTYNDKESKGNFFEKVEPEDEVLNEYLKLDCISLYDILQQVIELSGLKVDELVFCPTTASLSMKVYKTLYEDDYKKATRTKFVGKWGTFIESFLRAGYYGGRTEVFRPLMGNGYHYDINSLYPYVMKTFEFPIGIPKVLQDDKAETMYKYWKITGNGAGFIDCEIFVPEMFIPPLPYKARGKLMFPTGKLKGVWSFIEILEAEKLGCKIEKIHQAVYFERTAPIFKGFIEQFEEIKTHSVGAKRTFAKLVQNSLYGKFGMRRERTTYVNLSDMDKLDEEGKPYVHHKYNHNLMNVDFLETITISKAEYIQPHIAGTVTAYARIILLRGLLEQEKNGQAYYCDTDSIACLTIMNDKNVHDTEYGKWKLESIIEKGIFLQPKFYAELHKDGKETIKTKGIPKEIQKTLSFKDFERWLIDFQQEEKERITIFENLPSRQKFLTSLKQNTNLDIQIMQHKEIRLKAEQKRKIDYNKNITKPHNLLTYGDKLTDEIKTIDYIQCNDDVSIVEEFVTEFGQIQSPNKKTVKDNDLLTLYHVLSYKTKKKFFNKDSSITIYDMADKLGLDVMDILEELVYSL